MDGGTYSGQLGSLCLLFIEVSPLWNAEERLGCSGDLMDRIIAGRGNDPVCRTQKLRQIIDPPEFAQVAEIRFMSFAVDGASRSKILGEERSNLAARASTAKLMLTLGT